MSNRFENLFGLLYKSLIWNIFTMELFEIEKHRIVNIFETILLLLIIEMALWKLVERWRNQENVAVCGSTYVPLPYFSHFGWPSLNNLFISVVLCSSNFKLNFISITFAFCVSMTLFYIFILFYFFFFYSSNLTLQ